jgi:hypothetical protein
MVMFKLCFLDKIVKGEKTQTRRLHRKTWHVGKVYPVQTRWYGKPEANIFVTRKFQQRLGDINLAEVHKEGSKSLEEFQCAWIEINGSWDPDCVVWAYEFRVVDSTGE